jgi:translation initiation factor IF-3
VSYTPPRPWTWPIEAGLDLVEISPNADPPVCKIMDFGKFKYEQQKRESEARKKQKTIEVKEVKFRPNTDTHDYDVKMRNVVRFLEGGDKVKVTLRFRGREMAHQNLGRDLLERVAADVEGLGKVENMPKMEGRQMVMMIGPAREGTAIAAVPFFFGRAAARHPFSRSRNRSGRPGSLASSTASGNCIGAGARQTRRAGRSARGRNARMTAAGTSASGVRWVRWSSP